MLSEEVVKIIEHTFRDITDIFKTKGKAYANNEIDQLDNFKRLGKNLSLHPVIPLMVYTTKHWDSINNYISCRIRKEESYDPEDIDGRINDVILYLILLKCLLEEERSPEND